MTARQLATAALTAFIAVGAASCSAPDEAATSEVSAITSPDSIVAGDDIVVTVEVSGSGAVDVDVIDAFSTTTLTLDAELRDEDDRLGFEIPEHLTQLSGVVTFRATGAVGDDASASTLVLPSTANDPLDVVVGPRTVVADGADETMAIGFVADEFGNPLLDGTLVELTLISEANDVFVLDARLEGGVAPRLIGSGTLAQRVEVYASVDDGRIASRRVDYHEVPGPTSSIELQRPSDDETPLIADGRSSIAVRTEAISDQFGNQLIDGRLVRLETIGPDGVGQLTARTIDGIARFDLVAPSRPGRVTLRADADGVSSGELDLTYSSAISALPVTVSAATDRPTVSIGPVRDAGGAVVVDGTIARIVIADDTEQRNALQSIDVQLINGRATAELDVIPSGFEGFASVTVLGTTTTEVWP